MSKVEEKYIYKILDLPKHLQTTMIALIRVGTSTADGMSEITHKARAIESQYLNMLCAMKLVRKERVGKKVIFSVDRESLAW